MVVLRWVLIVATVALAIAGYAARFTGAPELMVIGFFAVLNLVYLLSTSPDGSKGRIRRMFGLWVDAKEQDLKTRAGQRLR